MGRMQHRKSQRPTIFFRFGIAGHAMGFFILWNWGGGEEEMLEAALPLFTIAEGATVFEDLLTADAGEGGEHHPELGELRILSRLDTGKGPVIETFAANEG